MAKNGKPPTGRKSLPEPSAPTFPILPVFVGNPPSTKKEPKAKDSLLAELFRPLQPNWRHYLRFADMAARKGDTPMRRFMEAYRGLDMIHKLQWWPEQICERANVSPGELVGAVCRQMWESNAAVSTMVASMAHPELLKSTIKFAKKEANYKDREMFFRMTGSLPDKKGSSINIFTQAAGVPAEPALLERGGKLKTFDSEVIEMERDLEDDNKTLYRIFSKDVPSDDHREDD